MIVLAVLQSDAAPQTRRMGERNTDRQRATPTPPPPPHTPAPRSPQRRLFISPLSIYLSISSYLDYSQLVINNPKFVLAQGNFFYNAHTVLVGDALEGLVMRENVYSMNECVVIIFHSCSSTTTLCACARGGAVLDVVGRKKSVHCARIVNERQSTTAVQFTFAYSNRTYVLKSKAAP